VSQLANGSLPLHKFHMLLVKAEQGKAVPVALAPHGLPSPSPPHPVQGPSNHGFKLLSYNSARPLPSPSSSSHSSSSNSKLGEEGKACSGGGSGGLSSFALGAVLASCRKHRGRLQLLCHARNAQATACRAAARHRRVSAQARQTSERVMELVRDLNKTRRFKQRLRVALAFVDETMQAAEARLAKLQRWRHGRQGRQGSSRRRGRRTDGHAS